MAHEPIYTHNAHIYSVTNKYFLKIERQIFHKQKKTNFLESSEIPRLFLLEDVIWGPKDEISLQNSFPS